MILKCIIVMGRFSLSHSSITDTYILHVHSYLHTVTKVVSSRQTAFFQSKCELRITTIKTNLCDVQPGLMGGHLITPMEE